PKTDAIQVLRDLVTADAVVLNEQNTPPQIIAVGRPVRIAARSPCMLLVAGHTGESEDSTHL
ncbi:MAG: hypothetical protein ACREMA_05405, partial [Longimicrobiales bacterium]